MSSFAPTKPKNAPDAAPVFAHPLSLRTWLQGDWGLLFSRPEDFARYDLEADRWLVLLREAFHRAGVRPLAMARHPDAGLQDWIAQVNEGVRCRTQVGGRYWPHLADFQPHSLREAALRSGARFVVVIDAHLRVRRTLFYAPGAHPPSVFDLIGLAARLREGAASRWCASEWTAASMSG